MWKRSIGYEIQDLLGEGSQGRVYRALRQDPRAGIIQTVAVKILHSETAVVAWKNEFESLSKVRSPYCVQVFGFERLDQRPSLILEYVDGISLAQLGKSCWLEEAELTEILAQAEAAVLDLHKCGAFHGDLSPQNIMINTDGQLRLLDFGLANCSAGNSRATPDFAAPERLCGEAAGLPSDIFSLGRIEQFLRGQSPAPDNSSPYLCPQAELRSMRGLLSDAERKRRLGEKVRDFKRRQELARAACTRTVLRAKNVRTASLILPAITIFSLLFISSAGQTSLSQKSSQLQIRTHRWHYFRLNGSPLGYAPVNVPVEAGKTLLLEWTDQNGGGSRRIQVLPGRVYQLSDRDFSH